MRRHRRAKKTVGLELSNQNTLIGKSPTELTPQQLKSLGHHRTTPLKALRARCLDCCAGQVAEVRKCVAVRCPSWPFRMGRNPWRRRTPRDGADEDE